MDLSPELRAALADALDVVREDRKHDLPPAFRLAIYKALGPPTDPQTQRLRGTLAVLAAQRILPIWHKERPADSRPDQLLNLALGVVNQTISADRVYSKTAGIADVIREGTDSMLARYFRNEAHSPFAYFVLDTVLEAVIEASGRSIFERKVNDHTKNTDLDWWHKDTTLRAVRAYSAVPVPGNLTAEDPDKRLQFWEWWLLEAIPEAWQMCQKDKRSEIM